MKSDLMLNVGYLKPDSPSQMGFRARVASPPVVGTCLRAAVFSLLPADLVRLMVQRLQTEAVAAGVLVVHWEGTHIRSLCLRSTYTGGFDHIESFSVGILGRSEKGS